jgi:2-amino-4-hydroxy-6-hydroxymethyldihydropteridine diphosphokinase
MRSLISLGANLGSVLETMRSAGRLLEEEFADGHLTFSHLYRTPPIGGPTGQSDFLNAVVALDSQKSCWEIWDSIKRVESELGRQRQHRWEARRIDIDLLLNHSEKVWTPHLKVPHPRMCMRSFVLIPASEIASELIDPVTGWTISQLRNHLLVQPPLDLLVVCNTGSLKSRIEEALHVTSTTRSFQAAVEHCPEPNHLSHLSKMTGAKLLIMCVETPDPETIQWEDFSAPWAQAMGLTTTHGLPSMIGPRYLLPGNDLSWAIHEFSAAAHAMTCPILSTEHTVLVSP